MNNLQSFLTIGGLLLLSLTSLRFNQAILETSTTDVENKVYLTAFSLADDMIEEIKVKSFDESTIQFPTTNTASLTPVADLGPESGETFSSYDDIDDFNGYTRAVNAPHAEGYSISCLVEYVDKDDPDDVSSDQTFYKRAKITVTSPYMQHPVTLSFIFTLK
ncbi:MAG TPA: hypothetical protein VKA26_09375 [Ignavibacteriaceae bacterium]|nr:hypothetical protein [Ignavibacteriaceae bacterium]